MGLTNHCFIIVVCGMGVLLTTFGQRLTGLTHQCSERLDSSFSKNIYLFLAFSLILCLLGGIVEAEVC